MANLDLTLIGKVNPGTNPQSAGMTFQTNAPLDDRCAVRNKASLISESAFGSNTYMYPGMAVSVVKSGEMYILINPDPTTITLYTDAQIGELFKTDEALDAEIVKHWKKLASSVDVSSLSGVFTFKGVAEAVSPDVSYIVTCQGAEEDVLAPIGTAVDLEGDVYYGWEIGGKQIWTDSLVLNSASTQYTRGEGAVVKCVVYNDIYYFTTEQVTDDKTILESISGHQIKVSTIDLQTTDPASVRINVYDGEITGDGYIREYTAYSFTPIPDNATVSVYSAHTIIYASDGTKVVDDTTIPDNSGHVYQIGENEYASNGTIWVKLGSPVEDWIII